MDTTSKFYDWNTEHDQANETMTHTFANGVRCIVSWKKYQISITYKGKTIDVFRFNKGSYTIEDHGAVLLKISQIAHTNYFLGKIFKTRERNLKTIRYELPCM